jgi:DNA-binding SARP family transcriptional activator
MNGYRIKLFHQISIQYGNEEVAPFPAKAQELLFYLLLHQKQPHDRELLADLLWSDISANHSKKYLRHTLWQLQAALGRDGRSAKEPLLNANDNWVWLNPQANLWLDTHVFERAFALVYNVSGRDFDSSQVQCVQEAVDLYRGDLLIGWYQEWCLVARERFRAMFLVMLDKLTDYCLVHDQFDTGLEHSMRLLGYDYTREKTHRRLMRLHYLAGDRTSALRQFEQCKAILAAELQIQPAQRTVRLYEQVCKDDVDQFGQISGNTRAAENSVKDSIPIPLPELGRLYASLASIQRDLEWVKQKLQSLA